MLTCATLAAALHAAKAGEVLTLAPGQTCTQVRVVGPPSRERPATLRLNGATIRGLHLLRGAGQLVVEGPGLIEAREGWAGKGPATYAVELKGVRDVTFRALEIREARTGIAVGGGSMRVRIERVRFTGTMLDGITIGAGREVEVRDSVFELTKTPDRRHGDAIQWWGEATDRITVVGNRLRLRGGMQGIGGLGPRPEGLEVRIEDNVIDTDTFRAISVAREKAVVRNNRVGDGDPRKLASIFMGPMVQACGNVALDHQAARRPAPEWTRPCR